MKMVVMRVLCFFATLALSTATVVEKDRTITKVVKLLQKMLVKSKAESDEERTIYGKFKCYCDTSEGEKKASVKEATQQISLLESQIEEVSGSTGELSGDCADLKAKMAENKASRDTATSLRGKEKKAFLAEEQDSKQAVQQMKEAINVLNAVGADQTSAKSADHKQFMAGKKAASLVSVQSEVQKALMAASALMNQEQRSATVAFVQAPFTGTYSSQSAGVMGIIKSMRDTFMANLVEAKATEKSAKEVYGQLMKIKLSAHKSMSSMYDGKQKELGDNDGEMSAKKSMLAQAKKQLASDQSFLDTLLPMCKAKGEGFDKRNLLRANEEAAIAEAVSILNSDEAFSSFGGVDATKSGKTGFIQLRSVHRHMAGEKMAQNMLEKVAKDIRSPRLLEIVALMQGGNPFSTVLKEIAKMIQLSVEEGKADKQKLNWCKKERKTNKNSLGDKKKEILGLTTSIDKLTNTIEKPKTGLKSMIQETETSLVQNNAAQKTQTADRAEENVAYQKDVKNLVQARELLSKAIRVLNKYYADLEKKAMAAALVQMDTVAMVEGAPEAWKGDGAYKGQSSKGGDAIEMLEFIEKETKKEEFEAHADEEKGQADFEDSMTKLKKEEAGAEKRLGDLQESLAEREKELLESQEDLKSTTKDKEAIESYLLQIKPGCDFITTNFGLREKNRATETAALEKSIKMVKATPAFKAAQTSATLESYGACKVPCVADSKHVKCKACMADVTVPAYCAGHKGAKGC